MKVEGLGDRSDKGQSISKAWPGVVVNSQHLGGIMNLRPAWAYLTNLIQRTEGEGGKR
jgi:hypothetical protein